MNKNTKKFIILSIISIVLSAIILLVVFIPKNQEIVVEYSKGLRFKLNEDGASYSVIGMGRCEDTIVVIPYEYDGLPVTSIAGNAFQNNHSIRSVAIPEGITSIGVRAFENCSKLTTVRISKSVTSIGTAAFDNCESIQNVFYSGDVTSWVSINFSDYGANPMRNNAKLQFNANSSSSSNGEPVKSVTIPNSITSIGDYAFEYCATLTSVVIQDGVTSIGTGAFNNCTSLSSITIPASVTNIDRHAFQSCGKLTNINFEGTVAQWNAITKGTEWTWLSNITKVTCSNGTVTIKTK